MNDCITSLSRKSVILVSFYQEINIDRHIGPVERGWGQVC